MAPQLAFTNGFSDSGLFHPVPGRRTLPISASLPLIETAYRRSLETFYDGFSVHMHRSGLDFLRAWQQVVRFGGALLSISTILLAIGLAFGTRRQRVGLLLFGIGGLSLLLAPALTANYWGRYTVPMAGPMMAAAAIAISLLWQRWRDRRLTAVDRAATAART